MGALLSRPSSPDYEQILADLTTRIAGLEARVSTVRHRERRWSVWIISYGVLIYILYVLYVFLYPRGRPWVPYRPLVDAVTLLAGPLVVYYTRRLVSWAYGRKIAGLETTLRSQRAQQRLKVEELKNSTSYYKTKGLIERFDVGPDGEPIHVGSTSTSLPIMPLVSEATPPPPPSGSVPPQNPVREAVAMTTAAMAPPRPAPTPQTWLDRLVDAIIGDDRNSRFALICQKCYAHNGLARAEEFDTIQYVCPNCHHLNIGKDRIGEIELIDANLAGSTASSPETQGATKDPPTPKQDGARGSRRRASRRKTASSDDGL